VLSDDCGDLHFGSLFCVNQNYGFWFTQDTGGGRV
jgi:hypothetical protein